MAALPKKKLEEIFQGIHSGKIDVDSIPNELSQFTYNEIMGFVGDGFGDLDSVPKINRMAAYDNNISAFSGAKSFQEVKDLSSFVFNADGTKRPFKEFKEFAKSINETYNVAWLKTEQDTAFGMSQSANQWMDIQDDKDLFPMLEYQTTGDGRVRDEHAAWDGVRRPVDDSFWDTRMPINGFNCRCTVVKLTEGKSTSLKGKPQNDDPLFNVNPGKADYIFNEKKHPYFKHTRAEGPAFKKATEWKPKVDVTPIGEAKTIKEAKGQFSNIFTGGTGVKPGSITIDPLLSVKSLNRYNKQLDNLFNEYKVADVYNTRATPKLRLKSGVSTYGNVTSSFEGTFLEDINFGSQVDTQRLSKGGRKYSLKSKVNKENIDISTLTHEFAHLLTVDRQSIFYKKDPRLTNFMPDLKKIKSKYTREIKKLIKASDPSFDDVYLGEYASTNINEFMAEAFTEYKLSSKPSKYAKEVGELIDKTFKK